MLQGLVAKVGRVRGATPAEAGLACSEFRGPLVDSQSRFEFGHYFLGFNVSYIFLALLNTEMLDLQFTTAALVDGWEAIDDRVMGGVSNSQLALHEDGYAVFSGRLSRDNGGSFASVRHPELGLRDKETVGYRLQVRGDGKRYKFNLRMDAALDGINYQAVFQPPAGRWVDIVLPLAVFSARYRGRPVPAAPALQPDQVRQVSWVVADAHTGPFELAVRAVNCLRRVAMNLQ